MIRIANFSVEEIIPLIGLDKPRIQLGVHSVKAASLRLECFRRNQTCVWCKRKGTVFVLEKHGKGRRKGGINCFVKDCQTCFFHAEKEYANGDSPHLNLYHVNRVGGLILMTKDHIMPRSRGGKDAIDNLQTMCRECNQSKGSDIPIIFPQQIQLSA